MRFTIREMTGGWRGHALAVITLGLFLTFIGPFQSQQAMTPAPRALFWVSLVATGYLLAMVGFRLLGTTSPLGRIAVAVVSAVPQMFIVSWALLQVRPGRVIDVFDLPMLFLSVLAIQALIVGTQIWVTYHLTRNRLADPTPGAQLAPPGRIAQPLRDTLIALEAEDHYVRVHHRSGSTLILHRFSDAIGEVEGADGLRVHRGWWIKRSAVDGTFIRSGKRWLILDNGVQVPVSRSYVRQVVQEGWPKIPPFEVPTVKAPERV